MRRHGDAGQAIGLVLIAIAFVAAAGMGVIAVSRHLTDRSVAQTAADAAALAGVEGGAAAAGAAARRNRAQLIEFDRGGGVSGFIVTVEVTVGTEHAVARASSEP